MPLPTMKTDWTEQDYYSAGDLNRVTYATLYLVKRLNGLGYTAIFKHIFVDGDREMWETGDIPLTAQAQQFVDNVRTVRDALPNFPGTPFTPKTMSHFTADMANDIEKILLAAEDTMNKIQQSQFYSGELFAGEV